MLAAARRGIPVHLHTPSEVKAAVTGNGRADKAQVTAMVDPPAAARPRRPSRPTPPTRWRWPSATSGAGSAGPARRPRVAAQAGAAAVIAVRPRDRAARRSRTRRSSRSAVSACSSTRTPRTLAALRIGQRRVAGHVARRPRGLPDALRLRRRGRAAGLRDRSRPCRGVGPRLALAMLAVHAPTALRGASPPRTSAALTKVPGIGRKGAAAHRPRAAATSSASPSGAGCRAGDRARRRPRLAGPGPRRPWSGWAGRPGRPTTPSRRSARWPPTAATVPALLTAALQALGRERRLG